MCTMNLWNEKDLALPPINTYKAVNTNIDIKHLHNVFREGIDFFNNEKFMYTEYVVLSRIVYRMKQKFRSAKDFKAMEKLYKALENYFNMNISSNLNKFLDLVPSKYKEEIYLPTKNLLDYILVRLQGAVKLMERIVETSKIAAYLLEKRMHIGHFWKIAFISFSLVSRVYTLARYTAKFVCDFYRKVLPFSSQLKNTNKKNWLPEGYTFPKDLQEWMNVDWLEFDDEVQIIEVPTEIPDIMKFFDLVDNDDDDVQFCDEYFMVDDDDDEAREDDINGLRKHNKGKKKNSFFEELGELRGFDSKEDIGEIIEIDDSFREYVDAVENTNETTQEPEINNGIQEPSENTSTIILTDEARDEGSINTNLNDLNKENIATSTTVAFTENKLDSSEENIGSALTKSSSDTDISINESDEDNINTISDESIIKVSDSEINTTTNVDSDEDVLTDLDSSSLDMSAKFNEQKQEVAEDIGEKLEHSICEDTIILVPDTPEQKHSSFTAINNDTVIVLDTPRKSLKKEKNLKQKNSVGKTIKSKHLNGIPKLEDSQGIQGNSSLEVAPREGIKKSKVNKSKKKLKNESKIINKNSKKLGLSFSNLTDSCNLVRKITLEGPLTLHDNQRKRDKDSNNAEAGSEVFVSKKLTKKLENKALNTKNAELFENNSQGIHGNNGNLEAVPQKRIKKGKIVKSKTKLKNGNQLPNNNPEKWKLTLGNLTENCNLVRKITLQGPLAKPDRPPNRNNNRNRKKRKQKQNHNSLDQSNGKEYKDSVNTLPETDNISVKIEESQNELNNTNSKGQSTKKIKVEPNSSDQKNNKKQKLPANETCKNSDNSFKPDVSSPSYLANRSIKSENTNLDVNNEQGNLNFNLSIKEEKPIAGQSTKKIKVEPKSPNQKNSKKRKRPIDISKNCDNSFKPDVSSNFSLANRSIKIENTNLDGNDEHRKLNLSIKKEKSIDSKENVWQSEMIHTPSKKLKMDPNLNGSNVQQSASNISRKSRKKKRQMQKHNSLNETQKLNNKNSFGNQSENQAGPSSRNKPSFKSKKKRYWEYSIDTQQSNNSIGFNVYTNREKKSNTNVGYNGYIPLASSTVFSGHNKPKTVSNISKKKKNKGSKKFSHLTQSNMSQKIKNKVKHNVKDGKGQKNKGFKKNRNEQNL